MSPFDRDRAYDFLLTTVTMALSHIVSEIFSVENIAIGIPVNQGH